ncbi:MAG: SEC-C metal-binding domain-containing protein, partial [Candidatus Thermochlorobacter sp.]
VYHTASEFYKRKEEQLGNEMMGRIERFAVLSVIDEKWREHLRDIDDLKEGINLRAYGQKDPLLEYKKEAFELFVQMLSEIAAQTLSVAFKLYPVAQPVIEPRRVQRSRLKAVHAEAQSAYSSTAVQSRANADIEEEETPKQQPIRVEKTPGRNDPCPCGSGKKYKNCHGKAVAAR